ncbi:2-dehydropantoate 2-reductase [Virgibacillus sp. NKC19-3]|uniref:2-dehydropantoate 2-reductase n=1 Tax=Virgibacillus saliphilus TaxID=2831674 RepID=UPI001C9A3381|nr:2-dehydropantoate 2-reductase [Virgibacillus sp. NKC19-3]MBY7143734.1 2-dehydropantoate 2-reductase [Virgibacillus sp. NKC19-3]
MKIGVIGGGSIGLFISGWLSSVHHITIYVRRKEQKEKINKNGLFFSHYHKSFPVKSMLIEEMKSEDCLIICVKQPHVSGVISLIPTVNARIPLIFLQNGMGHIDSIKNRTQPVFLGVIEHGARRLSDTTVEHTGEGKVKLASFSNCGLNLYELASQLNQNGFPVEIAEDWSQLLAEKLIINAVINPLTALFGCLNEDVLRNPYIRKLANELCKEAALVLGLNYSEQWDRVEKITFSTGKNISSMLKDIRESQMTEIEAISGYLRKNTDKELPYTSFVYNCIKALEMKKGIN